MYLIKTDPVTDPAINLAIEEFAVRNLDISKDYLFLYINRPAVIIGKHQNPFEEINLECARKNKVAVLRRISGGGTVYHDPGNLNFCFITQNTLHNFNTYKQFLSPIVFMLNSLGVKAEINSRKGRRKESRKD